MALVSEFVAAINQIASERGIDPAEVYSALESAVAAAFRKEYGGGSDIVAELDKETGSFRVISRLEVVEEVEVLEDGQTNSSQITVEDSQEIEKGLEVGDIIEREQEVEGFGRIAAQTAKQVIMQKVRESEKEAVLAEYSDKVGEVFPALMQRMQEGGAMFEIGKAQVLMPKDEQISNEFYRIGERYKVLLKSIDDTSRGKTLIVSRSAPEFLIELFRMEVPEIESEVVEVMACAREAGSRSKVAVQSHQDGVDPIGSCVGQRGVRIANVMAELGEEKIDIIEWRGDIADFVEKALSPAQVLSVKVEGDLAVVTVDEDQLSLAIGKDGQNVRLAAKLTDMRIDIQGPNGPTKPKDDNTDDVADDDNSEVSQLTAAMEKKLDSAEVTVEDASAMTVDQLIELDGIGKVTAKKIFEALKSDDESE